MDLGEIFSDKRNQAVIIVVLLVTVFIASSNLSTYPVSNPINAELTVYDNSGTNSPYDEIFHELTSEGVRIYTKFMMEVSVDYDEGLAGFKAIILDDAKTRVIASTDMTDQGLTYQAYFEVDGWATGYYWLVTEGTALQHEVTVKITNPAYTSYERWIFAMENEYDTIDFYSFLTPEDKIYYDNPPAELIDSIVLKDDADIYEPADRRIYIENPWDDLSFSFQTSQPSGQMGPVQFAFSMISGVSADASLVIYNSNNTRITESKDPNSFVFNQDGAQADDIYTATMIVMGAPGYNGASISRTFTVDNPATLEGEVTVYVAKETGWVEAQDGDTLSGDILVEVTVTAGEASSGLLMITGEGVNNSYEMTPSYDSSSFSIIIDTRTELRDGDYSITVELTRSEDNARVYLSVFDIGLIIPPTTSASGPSISMPIVLALVLLVVIVIAYKMRE